MYVRLDWSMLRAIRTALLLSVCWLSLVANVAAEGVGIAAAASLNHVLQQLGVAYQSAGGERLRVSYAASGVLARQIAHGAPFEVFLSANERYVEFLSQRGLIADDGVVYALGELVLFVPQGSSLSGLLTEEEGGLGLLHAALDAGLLKRLVMANPTHAPYGVAARDSLQHAGLWSRLKEHLVLGENAAQAAHFSVSGAADGGLIPRSLAQQPQLARRGRSVPLDARSYAPLRQRVVLLAGAGESARRFVDFLSSSVAQRILLDNGLLLPNGG